MGSETKFHCDECGTELGRRAVHITVLASDAPREGQNKFKLEQFNKIHYKHKTVYDMDLCYSCVGEEILEQHESEPSLDFDLRGNARRFLIKHGLLKEKKEVHDG